MENTKQLGLLGELKAQYDFIKNGFEVSIPLGDYCAYDLIIRKNGITKRIQVKTCEHITDGKIDFKISSRNYYIDKSYTENEADYFYLYCLENEQSYLYPVKNCNVRGIYLRIIPPKNNQVAGINFAKDFIFQDNINKLLEI